VNSIRKCGSRLCHGPSSPDWSVLFCAGMPGTGWRGPSAGDAPNQSPDIGSARFNQAMLASSPVQSVKRLTLYPSANISGRCPEIAARGTLS
jgi:hypothetical protein